MKNTENKTVAVAVSEYIKQLNLNYVCNGAGNNWGRTSFEFNIYFGRFIKPFKFYGSVNDYQNDKQELSDNELLYAYKCIISDAYCIVDVNNQNEFLSMFGYLDSEYEGFSKNDLESTLNQNDFKRFENGITAWKGCRNTNNRLKKSDEELAIILEELQELGIE